MVTEVRSTRNNNTVWIVVAIIAGLAVLAVIFMSMNGRDDVNEPAPTTVANTVGDASSAAADNAADAARAAQDAAADAASSAGAAARDAADATSDAASTAADRVQATIPAGDADITVSAPTR